MKKALILITILILNVACSFASSSDLYLYCDNTGVDKYKYDLLMKQTLIINDLLLSKEQKQEMDKIFDIYANSRALLANEVKQGQDELSQLKNQKAALSIKIEQRNKIKNAKKSLKKLDKTLDREVKHILTSKQKRKYNQLKHSLF